MNRSLSSCVSTASIVSFALMLAALGGCAGPAVDDGEAQDSDLQSDESIKSVWFDGTTYHVLCVDGRKVDVPYNEYASRLRAKTICAPQGPAPNVWSPIGSEIAACSGQNQPPSVTTAPNLTAVGCVPSGNQNVTPKVSAYDWSGKSLFTNSLKTSDGYYYTPLGLTAHGGEIQVVYDYNCDDHGSFNVGWGWGCIELRELSPAGAQVRSLVWGQTGDNSHPSLAFTGAELGVLWTSYKSAYFRRVNDAGLVGDQARTNSTLVGTQAADEREAAKSQVVWNNALQRYGAFNIFAGKLYAAELSEDGTIARPWTAIGSAIAGTFNNDFAVTATPTGFAVAYYQDGVRNQQPTVKLFASLVQNGAISHTEQLLEGAIDYRTLSIFTTSNEVQVVSPDPSKRVAITSLSSSSGAVTARGFLGTGTGTAPKAAYDLGSHTVAAAWLDDSKGVRLQRFEFKR